MRNWVAAAAALAFLASPATAQDRTDTPPPDTGTGRTEVPKVGDAAPKPKTDADRIAELERKVAELEAKNGPGKKAVDEKGAVKEAADKKPSDPQFEWGYDDGFFVKGFIHDQHYKIRPMAQIELDYRAFPHAIPNDQFLIRRLRVGFNGDFTEFFSFRAEIDTTRTNTTTTLGAGDLFFDMKPLPELRIRLGQFKQPWDDEDGMTSHLYIDGIERAMVIGSSGTLAPDFRPGAMVFGTFGDERFGRGFFQYYLAIANQTQNNVVFSNEPMMTARVASEVGPVILGVGGVWENRSGTIFRNSSGAFTATANATQLSTPGLTPGQFQFFAPVLVRGWSQKYTADINFYQGPFWARGQFAYASQERWHVLADHSSGTAIITQGACLTLGWKFWAPPASLAHPLSTPFKDWELFSMAIKKEKNARSVGAEVFLQAQYMSIDDARGGRFGQGGKPAAPSTAIDADKVKGNDCKSIGVGFNVYLIENVKLSADWDYLRIGDQARAERTHSRFANEFLFQGQLDF